jgi:hypothetical protein
MDIAVVGEGLGWEFIVVNAVLLTARRLSTG